MADQLEALLRRSPLTQSQRADVWDAYESTQDADALTARLQALNVPKQVKASLWDLKEASAKVAPAVEEEAFPTLGETARTFVGGAVRSLPGMALGAIEGATAPIMAIPNEAKAIVTGGPSPTAQALRESVGHVRAALAPGDAGPGRRLAEAASAIPMAAPIVKGAEEILTPAYKAATGGVGTVTPGEMKTAAETGGAATAGLAVPEIAKGAGNVTPATVGKVLKFTAKRAAVEMLAPGKTIAGKVVVRALLNPEVRKALGNIFTDRALGAIESGNLPKAAADLAQALEKHPEAAAIHAKDVAQAVQAEAAKVGASEASTGTVPALEPVQARPDPPMRDATPAAVAIRAANRRARQQAALARSQATPAAPEVPTTEVPTPVVEQAAATLAKRAKMPEKGNVKFPTVYTKPAGAKPIEGRPLTPKQREMRLKQLEAAQAAGLDIWEAFGVAKEN